MPPKPTDEELGKGVKELERQLADSGVESSLKDYASHQSVLAEVRGVGPEEDEESLLNTFLSEIVKQFGFAMAWYGRYGNGTIKPLLSAGRVDAYLDNLVLEIQEPSSPDALCAMSQAILREAPFSYGDLERDKGFRTWRGYALELGYRSNLAMPFRVDGRIEGGVMVYADTPHAFSERRTVRLQQLIVELGTILNERRVKQKAKKALEESEENFRALAENANDGIMIWVREGVHVYANKRATEITGYSASEMRNITIEDLAQPEELAKIKERYRKIIEGKDFPARYENVLIRKDGKPIPIEVTSARTTWHGEPADLVIFRDITERKRAREALNKAHSKLESNVQERTFELLKVNERLRDEIKERKLTTEALRKSNLELTFLNSAAQTLSSSLDFDQVLIQVMDEIKQVLSATGYSLWLRDPETKELICKQCVGSMCETMCVWRLQAGEGIVGWVVEKGEGLLVRDTRTDNKRNYKGTHQATLSGIRSILCVPLKSRDKVFGAIEVVDERVGFFDKGSLMLMQSLAAPAAIAIENAQLYRTIQQELTERKRAENALQKSEERYRHLVETMNEGLGMADQDYVFTYVNETLCEMLGYYRDELIGHNVIEFIHDDYKEFMEDQMARRRTGKAKRFDLVWRTKDGHKFYTLISPRGLFDAEGHFTGSLGVVTDITDRKQAEKVLQKAHDRLEQRTSELVKLNKKLEQEIEERKQAEKEAYYEQGLMQTLLNNIPDYVYFKDKNRSFVRASNFFCGLFGRSLEDIIGKKDEDFFPQEIAEETASDDRHVIKTGIPLINKEEGGKSVDGGEHWVLTTKLPWRDEKGKIIGLFGISREITERKQAEEALRQRESELTTKSQELEELNAALKVLLKRREEDKADLQDSVVVNVKELILPYIEKLKSDHLGPQQETLVSIIESNIKEIVSPFATKLSSKFLNLTPTEIKVASLVRDGRRSNEIAELMNLSPNTILFHRYNLRRKLGLKQTKVNLRSYLSSLQY